MGFERNVFKREEKGVSYLIVHGSVFSDLAVFLYTFNYHAFFQVIKSYLA